MPTDVFYYFRLAKNLNEECKDILIEHKARFRGSLNSICLVSLNRSTPQLNLNYPLPALGRDCKHLEQHLINSKIKEPKRATPEKVVQSDIISKSMETRIDNLPFGENIVLITDEFAKYVNGKKLVLDIIGFNRKKNALSLIELKSKRALLELTNQLDNAAKIVRDEIDFYQSFMKVYDIDWNSPFNIEKIAVWPCNENVNEKKFRQDIREILYCSKGDDIKYKEIF